MNIHYPFSPENNNHFYFFSILIILLLLFSPFAKAQTYPSGFTQSAITKKLKSPTAFAFAPASDGRIFITQQGGDLRVIKNDTLLSTSAIKIAVDSNGERGLIGIALDPDFTTNNHIYLYHTIPSPAHNQISRYTLNGDVVTPGSEVVVLDLDPLSTATNHNGGSMAFGPDGKLYVGVGENANGANAQDLDTYLGKLLRINSDGTIPSGNPYVTGSEQKKRLWAYGLRNPYTFDFQPGTGTLFIDDVGESTWEEINDATVSGHNFGWPSAEGMSSNAAYTNPLYEYGHGTGDGLGCAITGGTFFNPSSTNYPESYNGKYFFMDLCGSWINYIDPTETTPSRNAFATGIAGNSLSIQTSTDGNLYYLSRDDGALYKIVYASTTPIVESQSNFISSIYPQPASDVVYVDLGKQITKEDVSLVDLYGHTLSQAFIFGNSRLALNVSSLPVGIYVLKIGDSDKIIVRQISVMR